MQLHPDLRRLVPPAPLATRPALPPFRVARLEPGIPEEHVFLDSRPYPLWIHYTDGHSVLCRCDTGQCHPMAPQLARLQMVYIATRGPGACPRQLLCVSAESWAACRPLVDPPIDLRGWMVRAERIGHGRNSRVRLDWLDRQGSDAGLRRVLTMVLLSRLYRLDYQLPEGGAGCA